MDEDQHEHSLTTEAAWVTPEGILFGGKYYSCRRALRDGWFGQAVEKKPWVVRIRWDATAGSEMRVYIESESEGNDSEYECYPVQHSAAAYDVEDYQAKLRRLQEERRLRFAASPYQ